MSLSSNGQVLKVMSPPGAGTAQPPQGGLLDKLFPKDIGETIEDAIKDPFGKKKEEKERERQKKIRELYGGRTAAITMVSDVESIAQNAPENIPFGTLLNNMRYHGFSNKPLELINKKIENLKASCFSIVGAPFLDYSGYQDL